MKQVQLKKPVKETGHYVVRLGNYKKVAFTNILKCQRFVNDTNRFLTGLLQNLNLIYGEVFNEYRENWMYFDTNRYEGRAKKRDLNRRILVLSEINNNLFEFIYEKSTYPEGVYMVWRNLEKITENLDEILDYLIQINEKKSYKSKVLKSKMIKQNIENYRNKLKQYPD